MTKFKLHNNLTKISRKLTILPRGKIGLLLNNLIIRERPIIEFRANNGLNYIADLRSYTENYTPWTGEYEGASMDLILPLIDKTKNMMDIGGNVGYWSLNMKKANSTSMLYIFEPVLSNFNRIVEHMKLNQMTENTVTYNFGLSDTTTKAKSRIDTLDINNNAGTFNALMDEDINGECEIKRLDDIVAKDKIENVGFIKIDVEGYEAKVFKGAQNFLDQNRPIIYGEFTPNAIANNGDKPSIIFDIFKNYSFYQQLTNNTFKKLNYKEVYTRDILLIPCELEAEILKKFDYILD